MPRKRVPKIEIDVEATEAASALVVRKEDRISDRLRYEARAIYVTHPDGVTLDEIAKSPAFAGKIHPDTLRTWCAEDGWVEERRKVLAQFGDRLKSELQKALYSRIAQIRIRQLDTITTLKDDLLAKSMAADVKSAEGAAKVALDLLKYELELSQSVAQELSPGAGGSGAIESRNNLTDQEVLDAARLVLAARRKQQQRVQPGPVDKALGTGGGQDGAQGP